MDSAFSNTHGLVQALFDFKAQEEGELAFSRGDIITGFVYLFINLV